MKKIILSIMLLMVLAALPLNAQKKFVAEKLDKCDPYMKAQGGYGYLVENNSKAAVWWAEGCYKVMKDTPAARRKAAKVTINTARNEYESFIVVVNPKQELKNLKVELGGLPEGIEATIRKTEYVPIQMNSDSFGFLGDWPDPLPLYDEPQNAPKGENTSFWITLKTPAGFAAKAYSGRLSLSADGGWKLNIPVQAKVRNFTLPATPSVRSEFGLWFWQVIEYENLKTPEQKQEAFDNYLQAYLDYKISPENPFYLTPIKQSVTGCDWSGGWYCSSRAKEGKYSFAIDDNSKYANFEAVCTKKFIPVDSSHPHKVSVWAVGDTLVYSHIIVDLYDADYKKIPYRSRFTWVDTDTTWVEHHIDLEHLDPRTKYLNVRLFGAGYYTDGSETGTTWWDDLQVVDCTTGENLYPEGNFEIDPGKVRVELDFTDFNATAAKYFGEGGFTGFSVPVAGVGSVNFHQAIKGHIGSFKQGTPEYEQVMADYLPRLEDGLRKAGVLDKAYIYWGDEPREKAYPLLRETHRMIKKYAPGIHTFMTEMDTWRGHACDTMDISDCTDISCVSWDCFENHDLIKRYQVPGKEAWSYLCCGTRYPYFSNFIDHNAIDMRIWLWASYMYGFKGVLVWSNTAWGLREISPEGRLQSQWEEPYCLSGNPNIFKLLACGDGTMFYHHNRHPNEDRTTAYTGYPIPCVRLEILRDGIEDYDYLTMLAERIPRMSAADARKAKALLVMPKEVYQDDNLSDKEAYFIQDPQYLFQRREQIAALLEKYL